MEEIIRKTITYDNSNILINDSIVNLFTQIICPKNNVKCICSLILTFEIYNKNRREVFVNKTNSYNITKLDEDIINQYITHREPINVTDNISIDNIISDNSSVHYIDISLFIDLIIKIFNKVNPINKAKSCICFYKNSKECFSNDIKLTRKRY